MEGVACFVLLEAVAVGGIFVAGHKVYGDGVRSFLRWCAATGIEPKLDRATVNAFVAGLLAAGAEPSTARSRQLALRRFSAWCAEGGSCPSTSWRT